MKDVFAVKKLFVVVVSLTPQVVAQGRFLLGPFTAEKDATDVVNAPLECDELLSCAGVTFMGKPDEETVRSNVRGASANNSTFEDKNEAFDEDSVFFHGFLPTSNQAKQSAWVTYRSEKPFTFHRGKLIPSMQENSYTVPMVGLDEAKAHCQEDPRCAGFTFPVRSDDLYHAQNVTFSSSVATIDSSAGDSWDDSWRSYISNNPSHAGSVNYHNLHTDIDELQQPYRSCCNQDGPIPSLEQVKKMDTLERISCNISREEFYEKYEKTRTPVMLVGCDEEWRARERWTYENLIPRFSNDTEWRAHWITRGARQRKWSEIVDAIVNDGRFYIFEQLNNLDLHPLRSDWQTPGPFRGGDLYENLSRVPSPDYGVMTWFCMGTPFTGGFPHIDPISTDAWNSLVRGHKWWVIYPAALNSEDDVDKIECDSECSVEDPQERHWYASVGANAARNEYGRNAERPQHVLQRPGETIYVPFGRIHSVLNMDHTVAVTSNYGAAGNLKTVWEEITDDEDVFSLKQLYYGVLNKEQRRIARDSLRQRAAR